MLRSHAMSLTPRALRLPLLLLSLTAAMAATPAAMAVTADGWQWNSTSMEGVGYLPLEDIRSFYKFTSSQQDAARGTHSVGNAGTTLTFGPEPRMLSIGGYRCQLSHPVRVDERGNLLVSKVDMVKLIDPILRPTYIHGRRELKAIVIDPGHGGSDTGLHTPQLREADVTLALARQLAAELRQRGYEAILTREDNQFLSDQQRIDRANATASAIFISLHTNGGRSVFHGIETYTTAPATPSGSALPPTTLDGQAADNVGGTPGNEQDAANTALAFALQSSLVASTGAQDGACRRTHYSLLSSVRCPAALVELGYATHEQEGAALATEDYRATLATALANGIDTFARAIKPGATPPVNAAPPPPPPPTPVHVEENKEGDAKEVKKAEGSSGPQANKGSRNKSAGKKRSSSRNNKSTRSKRRSGSKGSSKGSSKRTGKKAGSRSRR